jgi:hypothetical protein
VRILYSIPYLLLLVLFSSQIKLEKSLDDILDNIYSNKKIDISSILSYKKGASVFLYNKNKKHNVSFFCDVSKKSNIKIDNIITQKILFGNSEFTDNLKNFDIDTENSYNISVNKKLYFVIPLNIKNCDGSFCRIYSCLLVSVESKSIYFFSNNEILNRNYFRQNNEGYLVYLNLDNSFSKPDLFTNTDDDKNFYFKITSLYLNENKKKWIIEKNKTKEKTIIIKTESQFNTSQCKEIENNWY